MGRKRLGKDRKVPIALKVDPKLKEALLAEAARRGVTLSRVGAYALQRWVNAHKHTRHIGRINDKPTAKTTEK